MTAALDSLLPQHPVVAVATAPGTAGIAVIRLSGKGAIEIADRLWHGRQSLTQLKGYQSTYGTITDHDGSPIDQAVATVFRNPHSFTGQDTVEFGVHGSPWIQKALVDRLVQLGAAPAGPGEFTRRAFLNGRIDLAQAEGIADLLAADSQAAHRLAMTQTSGTFSRHIDTLRQKMIDFASMLELELDFSEEDVQFADRNALLNLARETKEHVDRLADSYRNGRILRDGIPVAIAGQPNAGKSTLLNLLADDDKAIVSDIPGTTRDIIETTCQIDGMTFRIADTAGLRFTDDPVEAIGVDRALQRTRRSTIVLWLIDPTDEIEPQTQRLNDHMAAQSQSQAIFPLISKTDAVTKEHVRNIADRLTSLTVPTDAPHHVSSQLTTLHPPIGFSSKDLNTISVLRTHLAEEAKLGLNSGTDVIVTNARHHQALQQVSSSLTRVLEALAAGLSADLIAQDVRQAVTHLSEITGNGSITPDTLLHTIFSRFCIGK